MRPVWQIRISSAVAPMSPATAVHSRSAASRPGTPVAALALPDVRITPAALPLGGGQVGPAHLDRCRGGQVGREDAGGGHGPAVGRGHDGDVVRLGRLDAGVAADGDEALRRVDAHGYTPAIGSPVVSGSPSAALAHWIAWPDAPLTRLSSAHKESTQPVRGSTRAVTWAALEPAVALVEGGCVGHDDERLGVVGLVQGGHDGIGRRAPCRPPAGRNRWRGCRASWAPGAA